jgi:hypothetical protein
MDPRCLGSSCNLARAARKEFGVMPTFCNAASHTVSNAVKIECKETKVGWCPIILPTKATTATTVFERTPFVVTHAVELLAAEPSCTTRFMSWYSKEVMQNWTTLECSESGSPDASQAKAPSCSSTDKAAM